VYLALHKCEISACPDYRLRLHPTWLGPNMGCPIFEICIGDAVFSCFMMAELICVELKRVFEISFLSSVGLPGTGKMASVH